MVDLAIFPEWDKRRNCMAEKWQFVIQEIDSVKELIGQSLDGWKIEEITKVSKGDEEGKSYATVGHFRDRDIAEVYAGLMGRSNTTSVDSVIVLSNGKASFLIAEQKPLDMFNEESEAEELRKKILGKLTSAEQKFIGIS